MSDRTEFLETFKEIELFLEEDIRMARMPSHSIEWVKKLVHYTVPGGKLNRGLSVWQTYKLLKGRELTEEENQKLKILGWCVEFLQAFFLVADDLMDGSEQRRGKPCWYKIDGIGLIAANDSILLESFVFRILDKYFGDSKEYARLVKLFHETIFLTAMGQLMDLTALNKGPREETNDLSNFTIDLYLSIVKHKTVYYSFYLPISLAFVVHGITEDDIYKSSFDILLEMGSYFQIQDDILDCFGDVKIIGKIGTDIQEKKLTWLVVKLLERITDADLEVLRKCYGSQDDAEVERVKDLYRKYEIEAIFKEFEEKMYVKINSMIEETEGIPKEVFRIFLEKIFKRKK